MTSPQPSERVLSTLNEDGTRRWIEPRLARGRFLRRRQLVGYTLIALFVALPLLEIGGRPALLLDLLTREVSAFGAVFRPSDGSLLMLLGLTLAIGVFLVTALFGRVWCGWACPQTVYLELVFRPVERRFKKRPALKWAVFTALAIVLGNVFLAYFVGTARLQTWVLGSPHEHPVGFATVVAVAGLVLFDFGYFREQMCAVACPYGRLQSVLLDRQSLIIGYDARRGEPRSQPKRKLTVLQPEARGDCVDCRACVTVCPAGIDIRDGLQMECTGCAQCIDACDIVMDKLKLPRGLIGYTSQDLLAGRPRRLVRARTVIYPALLALCVGLFAFAVARHASTEVTIGRITGPAFVELPDGQISAAVRIKLENESNVDRNYTLDIADAGGHLARMRTPQQRWLVRAGKSVELQLYIDIARTAFVRGRRDITLRIVDDGGFHRAVVVPLLGPEGVLP